MQKKVEISDFSHIKTIYFLLKLSYLNVDLISVLFLPIDPFPAE